MKTPKPEVEESSNYDNYLQHEARTTDRYSNSLETLFAKNDAKVESVLVDDTRKKEVSEDIYRAIYTHFRNLDDLYAFCVKINQMIPGKTKAIFYPEIDRKKALFDSEEERVFIDKTKLPPKSSSKPSSPALGVETVGETGNEKWKKYWLNMPEFIQENNPSYKSITVKFRTKEDFDQFSVQIGQELSEKTKSIWYPRLQVIANRHYRWIQRGTKTLPKYPMYIVSKGRHESMFTSRSLSRMQIPHHIVIEPQDYDLYEQALDNFDIRPWVKLLIAPFSNHGDGPGRARNWAWDHSIEMGADAHWVFDDNINDFYRLNRNMRIRFESGVGFKVMEDFVDRFENVKISGPQYRFFIAPDQKYPPFVVNTRIYSTLLIRNDCQHRWRGRYNEDTDICLRVLKDGDCTVQFNAFMQGKAATQTVSGGNTAEFYHVEGGMDKEKWRDGQLNSEGTINKSQMLVDMHPDVARLVWRYGRWHHWVDYEPFKKNLLRYKEGVDPSSVVNEYGMELIDNFGV